MKSKSMALLSMSSLLIGTACAADTSPASDFTLGEIQVNIVGKKGPATIGGTSIGSEALREQDRTTVGEALNLAAGVSLSRVGARNEQMVYVRGFDLRQVPLYVDGIPVYVPYDGYVDLARFVTFDLARIDIAKGYSSALYGANTLGGAINLVSRRPVKAFEGEYGAGLVFSDHGDLSGQQVYTNLGSNRGNWYVQAGASYLARDFYQLPSDFIPVKTENGGRRDNSAQHDAKLNFKIGWTPNASDEYALNLIKQHGQKDVPAYTGSVATARYWQWPYWDKESIYFLSKTQLGQHTLRLRAYYDTFKNSLSQFSNNSYTTLLTGGSAPSAYDDFTTGFSVQDDIRLGADNQLQLAYNRKNDVHREYVVGQPIQTDQDRTEVLAIEDTQALGQRWTLAGGVSAQRAQVLSAQSYNAATAVMTAYPGNTRSATNAQAAVNYALGDTDALHASIARKSRFATIKDRYSFRLGTAIPNPGLQPEKATHVEAGYAGKFAGNWQWSATGFHSVISDMIQSTTLSATTSQMQNIGRVVVDGAEADLRGQIGQVELGGNLTLMNRSNRSNASKLIDTPRRKLFSYATWKAGHGWTVNASIDASSMRYSSSTGTQVASGFATVNAKVGYRLANGVLIEGGVRNLADRVYAYTEGFPEAGRSVFFQFNSPLGTP